MKKVYLFLVFMFCFLFINLHVNALDDGVYVIHSALDDNYILDAIGGKAFAGTDIQLYPENGGLAQKFIIRNVGQNYYEIVSTINENFLMDVYGGVFEEGSNIQLWQKNNGNAQKFIIKEEDNGYHKICSYNQNYCISVDGEEAGTFKNVRLENSSNLNSQKFRLEKVVNLNRTIEDGLYTISSALDNNMMVDVYGGIFKSSANIALYQKNGGKAQNFYINYIGDGYYSLKTYYDMNFNLDVTGSGKTDGTNVELYKYNGTDNQKWVIKDIGDGYYNIISKCNYLALDVKDGLSKNGTNIQMSRLQNSNSQKFKLNKISDIEADKISDGYYFINNILDSSKAIDINGGNVSQGTNVQLWNLNYSLAQKWYIKYNDGYYEILSDKDNNYSLQVDGTNVNIGSYTGADNQKWIIKKSYDGYYIISKNGLYLDLTGASTKLNTNIQVHEFHGLNAQRFDFKKTASGISENILQDGIYMISSALDSKMMVDVYGGKKANGTNVQLWQSNGGNSQKFKITYMDNGYYKINALVDLTKSIEVYNGSISAGANAIIYDSKEAINQQWIIKDAGDGYYNIISNCGGQYLDADGGIAKNGTNIHLWPSNGGNAQKFKFLKSSEKTKIIDVSHHQGDVDWDKVAKTDIYGVILRLGYWETPDSEFANYIKEIKRLNIPYGIYLFSYASTTNGATIEANFTKNMILKYDLDPTLGVYYDIEDWYTSKESSASITKEQYDNIINTYINNVSSFLNSKYKVKVYASTNYINTRLSDNMKKHVDWVADYRGYCGYKGSYSLWQFTSSAKLDGIPGYVDMSYLN